jgi:hypothetical protein
MDINNILLGAAGGIRFKVVMELSRAELGLSKIEEALYHANQAVEIYIKDPMRSNNNLHGSEDIELAEAFVAHGDVLVASGEKKRAIESYSQAEVIFFNHCFAPCLTMPVLIKSIFHSFCYHFFFCLK